MAVTEEPWHASAAEGVRPAAFESRGQRWYLRRELHLLAGIAVAALTVFFAGQRATDGARAALDARLVNAGAGANAALVAVEAEQLSLVREVTFSQGVAEALAAHDGSRLNALVTPLQAAMNAPMVDVVEPDGRVLLAVRSKGAPAPVASRKGLQALALAFSQAHGTRGGRLSELVVYRSGPTLLTIGPIMLDGKRAGAVLAMTPLADVLGRISQEVNAELTAYDANGDPIATTATFNPKPVPATTARTLMAGGAIVTRDNYAGHREKLGRLIVDHEPDAVLGVSLEDDSDVVGRWVSIYVALGLICTAIIFASFWARVVLTRKRYG